MTAPSAALQLCRPLVFTVAAAGILAILNLVQRKKCNRKLKQLKVDLAAMAALRQGERAGRTRAEKQLRELRQQGVAVSADRSPTAAGASEEPDGAAPVTAFPLRPIGTLQSVFSQRNGTPRQPLIVPLARARLKLRAGIPGDCLEGLAQYTHCWLLYIFHENTDLGRLWKGGKEADRGLKAKVAVPRLNGGRMGVLATRSPHRPCPIGLSVARIVAVEGDTLVLAGADLVNGTPVLDVKPYLPFCDGVPAAAAPHWVAHEAAEEPLQLVAVQIPPRAAADIGRCWRYLAARGASMYSSEGEFLALVEQALGRDIRSVHQRLGGEHAPVKEGRAPAQAAAAVLAAPVGTVDGSCAGGSGTSGSAGGIAEPDRHGSRPSPSNEAQRGEGQSPVDPAGPLNGESSRDGRRARGDESGEGAAREGVAQLQGFYHVVLEGIDISYDILSAGVVHVRSAVHWQPRHA